MALHASCKGSLRKGSQRICMHCATDPYGSACIVQGIPMALHEFCKGSLWICLHFARDAIGFAFILLGILMDLH